VVATCGAAADAFRCKEWVDAVKATGFDGIWRCELLSPKYWELDPWTTARDLKAMLQYMLF
jgi:alkanesulfonate monooxygenase SsuD/methylene tetrahydromethanopterin reductase-like flavin-dependent oxidoreductase (luciferase family)